MTTTRRTPSNTEIEQTGNGATTGYEAELWQMADDLRGSMDTVEYKHVAIVWRKNPAPSPIYGTHCCRSWCRGR